MERLKKEILEWVKLILIAILISIIIDKFIISISIVDGESMELTLKDNDRLFINKICYLFNKPKRGDIIIFNPPIKGRNDELFVKRIIAVEGDRFCIHKNKIYINGEVLKENYIKDYKFVPRNYAYLEGVVPKGYVFVMGDNRNNSNDSRTFGYVPVKNIKGKVVTKIWPLNEIKTFSAKYPKDGNGIKD
ncbi:signal peptidase I [Thermohalobacter berrensis]|uniref:Signal peptidase I n=1 Tax=Thermohalobacter berrensis TaxID=99594 RepID=A0A419SV23_9FIRM|nr:signal peptidase I [Thermohalobacter berrensis]RKD29074.1 signal peptidase I [Thermohalobacter berrensis]